MDMGKADARRCLCNCAAGARTYLNGYRKGQETYESGFNEGISRESFMGVLPAHVRQHRISAAL